MEGKNRKIDSNQTVNIHTKKIDVNLLTAGDTIHGFNTYYFKWITVYKANKRINIRGGNENAW